MAEANKKQTLTVTFAGHSQLNVGETERKGRPIFDDIEICEIRFPGDLKCQAVFPAHEAEPNATREAGHVVTYAEHYNEQYRKFKAGLQQTVSGTPLSEAPFLTEGKRRELRALNVHTVEQLAGLDGANLKTLGMGGREWKNQAAAFLAAAAGTADVTGMAAKIAKLEESLAIALANNRAPAEPAPSSPAGNDGEAADKSIEDCTDEELREFIKKESGKAAPHNAGRAALLARATELATADEKAA
jgi:hypothetical protein